MSQIPHVSCGPIDLRLITPRTAHQLFALAREPEVSRQLQWHPHESVEHSLEFIHDARKLWQWGSAWMVGVFEREREQLVGCTGVYNIDRANRRAEVGTWFGLPFQGRGFNRYAKAAVAAFAYEVLGLNRLEYLVRVDNERSIAAMRALPGIREEGVVAERIMRDGVAYDAVQFALLKCDFDPALWPEAHVASIEPPQRASTHGVGS